MITLHFNSLSRLVLQPHEFSWPLLPSPSDGEPQVLGEPSLSGCIHKTILPPPASAMKRFPPRVVIMKCHRGNSWNIICACSLSPHPASPPTSLLTFWSYVCCTRKTLLAPLLPPDLQRGVSVPHSHCDKNRCLGIYPCSLTAPWYLVATLKTHQTPSGVTAFTRTTRLLLPNNPPVQWHYKEGFEAVGTWSTVAITITKRKLLKQSIIPHLLSLLSS